MRKLLFVLAAMAIMGACSKDEVIKKSEASAVGFSNIFINNSTRSVEDHSYTKQTLGKFEVYGTITNKSGMTSNIFNQEKVWEAVVNDKTTWVYDAANTQYWIPANTYNFTAIADGNVVDKVDQEVKVTEVTTGSYNMPKTIELYDASKQRDILYAESNPIAYVSGEKTVEFTFSHLMSKAKFTFKNEIATNSGYSYKIKNVKITNAQKAGSYSVEKEGWYLIEDASLQSASYELDFGNVVANQSDMPAGQTVTAEAFDLGYGMQRESYFERLLVPTPAVEGVKTYVSVKFKCEVYKSGILIDTQVKEVSAQVKLLPGNAYNLVVALGNPGEPIRFTVHDINGWVNN